MYSMVAQVFRFFVRRLVEEGKVPAADQIMNIFNMQFSASVQAILESVIQDRELEGGAYYILYLIYNNRLREAQEQFSLVKPASKAATIEILLSARNSSLPAALRFIESGKLIENPDIYRDARICNSQP